MAALRFGGPRVPTPSCPPALAPEQAEAVRARRAAKAEGRRVRAERRAEARGDTQASLDQDVTSELERLALAPWEGAAPPDPYALGVGARLESCDGARFIVVKVGKTQPSRDQVAVELFRRIGE